MAEKQPSEAGNFRTDGKTVLATPLLTEFLAGDIRITPEGVALTAAEARRVQDAAKNAGVRLIEKEA